MTGHRFWTLGLALALGTATRSGAEIQVTPRDGVRKRLAFASLGLALTLDRDQWRTVSVSEARDRASFTLDNPEGRAHAARLTVRGLAAGRYAVKRGGVLQGTFDADGKSEAGVALSLPAASTAAFTIEPG